MAFATIAETVCDGACNLLYYSAGDRSKTPKLIAHRGAWDRGGLIENTMPAFTKARDLGMWGIEFDLRFTADDVPVVQHDPELSRVFGKLLRVESVTRLMLLKEEPQLCDLEQVLSLTPLHLLIEIKELMTETQMQAVKRSLAGLTPLSDYHFLTLNPRLVRVEDFAPASAWVLVGELRLSRLVEVSIAEGLGGVAGHYLGMTRRLIERLHAHDQKAGVGFTPTLNLFNREWRRNIDWVFTNSASALCSPAR